jgi:hypothetical protein
MAPASLQIIFTVAFDEGSVRRFYNSSTFLDDVLLLREVNRRSHNVLLCIPNDGGTSGPFVVFC